MKLFKKFTFEAGHSLPDYPMPHGHSYYVEVWVKGDANNGYVMPEAEIDASCKKLKDLLDHKYLNDFIPIPTSENIARFIWANLKLPLIQIKVERPTVGLGVVYEGD